jgi:hypothetical protein
MTIERTNLINNNSFEAASTTTGLIQGWEIIEGKAGVSDRAASSGRRALQIWPAQRQVSTRVLSDFIAVNEASDFAFSIWARSENGQQNAAIGIELYDANRRLRNRIWAIRPSALLGAGWQKIEARLVNTKEKRLFAANNAFMRIVLQTGPFSEGSVLFDDLSLRPFSTPEPVNLLAGGDFERADPDGRPEGINGSNNILSIDYDKFNTGYASLRLKASAEGETGFAFAPLAAQNLKAGQQIACSLFFQADRQQKGMVIVEMLDANQKPLARRLAQYEFEAVADRWQATSFSWKFDIQKEEEAQVKAIQVRVAANMAVGASLWLDTMVMR